MRYALYATAVSVFLLVAESNAHAADQGITGKKLLLKSNPKMVLLSKDASISIAGSDPVNGVDSSVSFDDGSGPVTFALPASLWSTSGSGTLFKYKNVNAPGGPSVVKIAKVKAGLLKVVAKGLPFAVPSGPASIDVRLSLNGGINTYCMTFSGTGDGSKFLVKDATAGTCAPPTPTVTPTVTPTATATPTPTANPCAGGGQSVGGFCWYLGAAAASCDATCTGMGLTCSAGTIAYAGTGGTTANCEAVLTALGAIEMGAFFGDDDGLFSGTTDPVGCCRGYLSSFFIGFRVIVGPTTCAAADTGTTALDRACACE